MKKLALVIFILLLKNATIVAQNIDSIFAQNKNQLQQENLYVHFDKQHYYPSETIWFKGYFTTAGLVGTNSTALKIDIINERGDIVIKKIFPILAGVCNGNFTLPADLPIGNYLFRAYTKWMMQFNVKDFYQKNITVGSPNNLGIQKAELNVQFFPEGGNLVGDVMNLVGFSCFDKQGLPQEATGFIISSQGDTITQLSTTINGMGKFGFTPKYGENYTAIINSQNDVLKLALPSVQNSGIALQIATTNAGKMFAASANNVSAAYILGYRDNEIFFKTILPENKKIFTGTIPTKNISSGIITIAIFDKNDQLLAQRQTFVNNKDFTVNPTFTIDTVNTKYRGKNVFSFNLPDSLEGNFSITVTNASIDKLPITNNISNQLVLQNKLEQSFNNTNINLLENAQLVEQQTDLLLLTSTPRYTDLQKIIQQNGKQAFVPDNFISLKGVATSNGKKILADAELTLIVQTKDSSVNYLSATSDKEGKFNLEGLLFEDTATIFYQNNSKKNKDKSIEIINETVSLFKQYEAPANINQWQQLATTLPKPLPPTKNEIASFDTSGTTLTSVTVTAKKKNPTVALDEKYTSGMFSGMSRSIIDFVNNPPPNGNNIFQYLQGRFSYLTVVGSMPNYKVQYRNTMSLAGGPIYMALYLDEFLVDASTLLTVPIQNIAMIKIFTTGFFGSDGVGGALAVYTKKHEDGLIDNVSKLNKISLQGFSTTNVFEAPTYNTPQEGFLKKDNRTTLYWNPSVNINNETKTFPIRFYNSDNCTKFRLVIEGITSDGKMVYFEKFIE